MTHERTWKSALQHDAPGNSELLFQPELDPVAHGCGDADAGGP
jgi:hypothetical protein